MKPIPECVPDILCEVLATASQVSDDEFIRIKVLKRVMSEMVDQQSFGGTPTELLWQSLAVAYKTLGVKDPYANEKARRNKVMSGLVPTLRTYVESSNDHVSACLGLALASSVLDLSIFNRSDAEQEIFERLALKSERDDSQVLLHALHRASTVMYLVDAAGEIAVDKLVIEELARRVPVTVVVAHQAMLLTATVRDAEDVGLLALDAVTVTDPGVGMLGLNLEKASSAFRDEFNAAGVVIARGQWHYETLSNAEREIFFVLRAACTAVAQRLGVGTGARCLVRHHGRSGSGVFESVSTRKAPS